MSFRPHFLTLCAAGAFGLLAAQSLESTGELFCAGINPVRIMDFVAPWFDSDNPAAVVVVDIPDYGTTQLGANYLGGNLRRAQQNGSITALGFSSDSYCLLSKIKRYGRLAFTQQRHRDRCRADNFASYIAGSELPDDYFDFGVKATSPRLWRRMWLGSVSTHRRRILAQ